MIGLNWTLSGLIGNIKKTICFHMFVNKYSSGICVPGIQFMHHQFAVVFLTHVYIESIVFPFEAKADLKEKLQAKPAQPAAPKAQPATAPIPPLKGPMEFETTDKGCFRIQVKPQKGRATIVVLMHKPDDGKFAQKLQIVVKPNELPLADCIAIMQLLCLETTEGNLGPTAIKLRRDELIQFQKSVGLKQHLENLKDRKEDPPYDYRPNEEFLQAYIDNQQQDSDLRGVPEVDNTEEKRCTLANLTVRRSD